jgi:hypothetical protein
MGISPKNAGEIRCIGGGDYTASGSSLAQCSILFQPSLVCEEWRLLGRYTIIRETRIGELGTMLAVPSN